MKRPEQSLQQSIVVYLRTVLSARDYRVSAIPNSGRRGVVDGRMMKLTGTLAGMPDLQIVGPGGRSYFVEVKAPRGKLSEAQEAIRDWMILKGVPYVEARSLDDVKAALVHWKLETREAA